jgi:large subunit ribosomal protein L6
MTAAPDGVTFEVAPSNDAVTVKGANRVAHRVHSLCGLAGVDLMKVGRAASEIRKIQPPNVYTGKGIKYADEEVKLKSKKKTK